MYVLEIYDQNGVTRGTLTYDSAEGMSYGDMASDIIELIGTGTGIYSRHIDARSPVEKAVDDVAYAIDGNKYSQATADALDRLVVALKDEVREDLVKNAYVVETEDGYLVRFHA